jgi:LmbE family N-acetylglucosaminyl deacetylase
LTEPRRILVLAPHPDDEIVACGIAAMRARAAGARVFVLYLTTGIPAREALWPWQRPGYAKRLRRRRDEAWAAAASVGFEPIGFADRPSRRLRQGLDAAAAEIERSIAVCDAEALWVPAFEGGHQDHDAANAVAARFCARLPVHEFAAYNFAGGQVRANRFADQCAGEHAIEASAEEMALKRRALACYASERGNLRHIGVTHEAWRPLPSHDYGAPPHPGRLFRERFHWVPFRHPRIDFDASVAVYADIGRWASAALARRHPALGDGPGEKPGQTDREFAGALDEAERKRGLGR